MRRDATWVVVLRSILAGLLFCWGSVVMAVLIAGIAAHSVLSVAFLPAPWMADWVPPNRLPILAGLAIVASGVIVPHPGWHKIPLSDDTWGD